MSFVMLLWQSVKGGVGCGCVLLTVCDVFGYVARVDGASMRPTLNPTHTQPQPDYVFLSRWAARNGVRKGDVVSLHAPKDPDKSIIKRVVALAGEPASPRIPQGHCWVEGDNTGHTLDSTSFGPVSLGLVTAKALYVVWPPNRWGPVI